MGLLWGSVAWFIWVAVGFSSLAYGVAVGFSNLAFGPSVDFSSLVYGVAVVFSRLFRVDTTQN